MMCEAKSSFEDGGTRIALDHLLHEDMTVTRTARGMPRAAMDAGVAPRRRGSAASLVAPLTVDPIRLALFVLMLVTISQIHQLIPILKVFRPGLTLTALALGLAVVMPKAIAAKDLFSTWPARRVAAIFALAVIGVPLGLGASGSFKFITEVYFPNLVFFGLLIVAVRNISDLRTLVGSYVLSMTILLYMAIFVWGSQSFNGFSRLASTLMYDANDLGVLFAAGMPLALLFAQTSTGPLRWLGFATAAGGPAAIALGGSRGGFLSLLAVGIGLLTLTPRITWGRRLSIIGVAVCVMALFAPDGYIKQMSSLLNAEQDYNITSETGRVEIWKRGLRNLAPRPFTGVGIGNFARAQWANQEFTVAGAPIRAMSSHNSFVQIAVELGVPAFLIFVSILFGGIRALLKIRKRMPRSWLTDSADRRFLYVACSYLPVSFIGWATGAFFVSHAYLMPFYVLAAYLSGVLLLYRREMKRSAGTPKSLDRSSVPGAFGPGLPSPVSAEFSR